MKQQIERALTLVLFGLCEVVSIAFTVQFTVGLARGPEPVAIGAVLELAKLTFSFVVVTRYRQRRFVTMVLASVMLALLCSFSAVASTAFFDVTTRDYARDVAVATERLARLGRQADVLERERELLTQSAERDLDRDYRWRALETQERISGVRQRLDEVTAQLDAAVEQAPAAALVTSSVEAALAIHRTGIVLTLAVLLEVLGFVSLQLLCSRDRSVTRRVTSGNKAKQPASIPPLRVVPDETADRVTRLGQELMHKLRTDQVKPAVRDIRVALGVQQKVAQQVLYQLIENGSLVREGRRYRIAK